MLEVANKFRKKVLITSTSEIYGKSEKVPYKEDDDRLLGSTNITRWSYSSTKAIDEFLCLAYHHEKKLPIVIVRCFNTVGPRQTGQYGMVIPKFIKSALMDRPLTVYGDGKQSRCFADVSDVVDGMIKLVHKKEAEGEIFNIGAQEEITIHDLAKRIIDKTSSKSKIEFVKYEDAYEKGFEDMRRRMPDLSKIKKMINYKPKKNLNKIIDGVVEYYEK